MINPANLCIFEGRVSRDPQYSTVQMGQESVEKALFSIAVDRALSSAQRQKVKNGDQTIKTADFIPCSLLGAQVATLRQYFPKGKAIRVMGHYTEYQTTDQQSGQTKYGHMFEIDNISFVVADSKNLQGGGQAPQQGYQQPPMNNGYQQAPQQNYQQGYQQAPQNYQPQQNYQAPPQQQPQGNNFAMFDESASPF
jgi:single-stranded DNA-binding protein